MFKGNLTPILCAAGKGKLVPCWDGRGLGAGRNLRRQAFLGGQPAQAVLEALTVSSGSLVRYLECSLVCRS